MVIGADFGKYFRLKSLVKSMKFARLRGQSCQRLHSLWFAGGTARNFWAQWLNPCDSIRDSRDSEITTPFKRAGLCFFDFGELPVSPFTARGFKRIQLEPRPILMKLEFDPGEFGFGQCQKTLWEMENFQACCCPWLLPSIWQCLLLWSDFLPLTK